MVNDTDHGRIDKSNATACKLTWGHTIYHELMHLDPVVADRRVTDVKYGACDVAKLAEYNGCTGDNDLPGWYRPRGEPNSLNKADSWAMYASAAYFQDTLKLDAPGTAPDCNTSAPFETADDEQIFGIEGVLETSDWMEPALVNTSSPPPPSPDQIPAPDGPTPVMPINPQSPPSGLATPFASAVSYFASLTNTTSKTTAPAFTSTSSTAPTQL